jgi:hypothetical protein
MSGWTCANKKTPQVTHVIRRGLVNNTSLATCVIEPQVDRCWTMRCLDASVRTFIGPDRSGSGETGLSAINPLVADRHSTLPHVCQSVKKESEKLARCCRNTK